ncbi:MAG: hypothetical protein Q7T19_09605 [Caulobacter sp.]|nr:hypothetical protein [Caulobacter sp.]
MFALPLQCVRVPDQERVGNMKSTCPWWLRDACRAELVDGVQIALQHLGGFERIDDAQLSGGLGPSEIGGGADLHIYVRIQGDGLVDEGDGRRRFAA